MTKDFYWNHLYILATVVFTVYGQVVLKWRIGYYGELPDVLKDKIFFLIQLLIDPIILSALFSAFVASLFWMMAMSKFDMSYAYPFIGSTYMLNLILALSLLGEPFTWNKVAGNVLILLGIIIAIRTV